MIILGDYTDRPTRALCYVFLCQGLPPTLKRIAALRLQGLLRKKQKVELTMRDSSI
jgi:hypothetical protein